MLLSYVNNNLWGINHSKQEFLFPHCTYRLHYKAIREHANIIRDRHLPHEIRAFKHHVSIQPTTYPQLNCEMLKNGINKSFLYSCFISRPEFIICPIHTYTSYNQLQLFVRGPPLDCSTTRDNVYFY